MMIIIRFEMQEIHGHASITLDIITFFVIGLNFYIRFKSHIRDAADTAGDAKDASG